MSKYYNVGKIVNTHGVRGEVRILTRSDFGSERYRQGSKLYCFVEGVKEPIPLIVRSHRQHKNFDLLTFEGHDNINDVLKYKGSLLKVHEDDREDELTENEYYYEDIIGSQVLLQDGTELGKIKEILSPGANDVWVVQRKGKGKDIYLPYIEDVVKEVDPEQKKVIVELLEGLVDD